MPEQPDDDGLVPPIKVMRRRLNGVYSAEHGFAGTTRRYVLIVAMLVGLASLPTLAAITAGSQELDDNRGRAMDTPFIPPASSGPVRVPPFASQGPGAPSPDATASDGSSLPGGPGVVRGHAQEQKARPDRHGQSTRRRAPAAAGHGSASRGPRPSSHGSGGSSGGSGPSAGRPAGHRPPASVPSAVGLPQLPVKPVVPDESRQVPVFQDVPDLPHVPDDAHDVAAEQPPDSGDPNGSSDGGDSNGSSGGGDSNGSSGGDSNGSSGRDDSNGSSGDGDKPDPQPAKPVRPQWCLDRSDCSARPAHHHRRGGQCGDSAHRAHRARHGRDRDATVTVHIESPTSVLDTASEQPKQVTKTVIIRVAKAARSDSAGGQK